MTGNAEAILPVRNPIFQTFGQRPFIADRH